jgi:hypothetical protein
MLDLKGVSRVGPAVLRLLHERVPEAPLIVCARWWPSVEPFRGVLWVRLVLSARARRELSRLHRRLAGGPLVHGVSVHRELLDEGVVRALRRRVERVMTWPVDDATALGQVLDAGVNKQVLRDVVGLA